MTDAGGAERVEEIARRHAHDDETYLGSSAWQQAHEDRWLLAALAAERQEVEELKKEKAAWLSIVLPELRRQIDSYSKELAAERQRAEEAERQRDGWREALAYASNSATNEESRRRAAEARVTELQAFIGEPGQLTYEQLARELIDAEARVAALEKDGARLRAALETAKRTLRTWSEMGSSAPPQWLDEEWALYQESPEMKEINAALAPPGAAEPI